MMRFRLTFFLQILLALVGPPVVKGQSGDDAHRLIIRVSGKDSGFAPRLPAFRTGFPNQPLCLDYIQKLPAQLQGQGYAAASVDSLLLYPDSTVALLYVGRRYQWARLLPDGIDRKALEAGGYFEGNFRQQPLQFNQVQLMQERILRYYENNGFPFAAVMLDSVQLLEEGVDAHLKVTRGPLYHIDSIRVYGKVKIASHVLQRYLGIMNHSLYARDKLEQVSRRLADLPYLQEQQPSDITMLGTGAVLNLYLQQRRSSQVNFLVGFLPENNQTGKLQLTGDVNLNLKNALGSGETILVNWQQLQLQSPRLNIGYQHPFVFRSPFGLDFAFELFKKDSTFLQLNAQAGIQYLFSARQSGRLFLQQQSTTLLAAGTDTQQVKITRRLPPNIDVRSVNVGLDYEWNNTNYRFNPRSGNEVKFFGSVGIRTIKRNSEIISLTDPGFNFQSLYDSLQLKTYQFRLRVQAAHYFPVGRRATVKLQASGGWFNSPNIFRNELFQIGGFRLLRGFDEESIFATRYGVITTEYRYLLGLNSYLFGFADAGWVQNKFQDVNVKGQFISTGLGLSFETRFGLLNMSFALGKRSDTDFDMRRASKIHFGYVNYF
jgi:outer membrane protein assembly factor BamA